MAFQYNFFFELHFDLIDCFFVAPKSNCRNILGAFFVPHASFVYRLLPAHLLVLSYCLVGEC